MSIRVMNIGNKMQISKEFLNNLKIIVYEPKPIKVAI